MQKLVATSKIDDIDTATAFVSHMSDWFFEKSYDKRKHVNYIKTQTQ